MERDAEFRGSWWDQREPPVKDYMWEQKIKIAAARKALLEAIAASDEKDIAIWIAALTETLGTVSDWNLQAERDQARRASK